MGPAHHLQSAVILLLEAQRVHERADDARLRAAWCGGDAGVVALVTVRMPVLAGEGAPGDERVVCRAARVSDIKHRDDLWSEVEP